ncbi:MAG: hypothetical protein KTR31_08595 [Myxococcales bacterium]|nr:hypothetical protein [Myxococcales bacterium]
MRAPLSLLLLACSGKPTTEPPPIHTGDTATPGPMLVGQQGSVVLGWRGPMPQEPLTHYAFARFAETDADVSNAAHCLLVGGWCVRDYADVGEVLTESVDPAEVGAAPALDAGRSIEAMGVRLLADWTTGSPVYRGSPLQLAEPASLRIGGDLHPFEGEELFAIAEPLEMASPNPAQTLVGGPGGDVTLRWKPAAKEEGTLVVQTATSLYTLDPTAGSFDVPVDDLALRAPFDRGTFTLSRIVTTEVDAAGNAVTVQTRRDQTFVLDYIDTEGFERLQDGITIARSCGAASTLKKPLAPGVYHGTVGNYPDSHDLGADNPFTGVASAGRDGVVQLGLLAGQTVTATYRQGLHDSVLYVLGSDCAVEKPLATADDAQAGDAEQIVYAAAADATVFLVLDSWLDGASFSLELDIQ